jgi:hypothetical protein
MSLLISSLETIRFWLQRNYAEGVSQLPPGLRFQQIEEFEQFLQFKLVQEVYDLYQFSCGNDCQNLYGNFFDPYDGMGFCSLQRAAELASVLRDDEYEECDVKFLGQPLLPIFEFEGSFLCTVGALDLKYCSPIIFVSDIMEVTIRYVSLTSMMQTIAECFETGAVHKKNTFYDSNIEILEYDKDLFSVIYQKYNSNLPEFAISNFCKQIERIDLSLVQLGQILTSFVSQIAFLKIFWKDLSLDQLSSKIKETLYSASQSDNDIIVSYVNSVLDMLTI